MKKSAFALFAIGASFAWLDAASISAIRYEGLSLLSAQSANDIAGLRIRGDFNDKISDKALQNLYKQGYFEEIAISQTRGEVVVRVKEKKVIAKLDIKGVVPNDKKAILEILEIKKGQVLDQVNLKRTIERVRQFYEARGYFDTVVSFESKAVKGSPNSVEAIFSVNRGERITIKDVRLIGAKKFSYGDVEGVVENKAREWLGWLWGRNDGRARIFDLPNDANKVKDEYLRKGYLNAEVSQPFMSVNFDDYSAEIYYYINEGERFRVQSVEIDVPQYVGLDKKRVMKGFLFWGGLRVKKGAYVNNNWLKDDIEKIRIAAADKGYAFARVTPDIQLDKQKKTAKIIYRVTPDAKTKISNVIISGNDKTLDRIIRRDLFLAENQTYSYSDMVDSRNKLRRTGYFSDVQIREFRTGENTLDLRVDVTETPTGSIQGGIGYGSGDGFLINAGVSEGNIFGTGYKGSLSIDRSGGGGNDDTSLTGSVSLTNPRLFDSQYSLGGSLFGYEYDYLSSDSYKSKTYGFDINLGRELGRYANIYLGYGYSQSDVSYGSKDAIYQQMGYSIGKYYKSSASIGIGFNNTDDYYLARSGWILGTNFEYAGGALGGDTTFMKSRSNFAWYLGLRDYINWDLILRFKGNFNYIWSDDPFNDEYENAALKNDAQFVKNNPRKLPISEKFYLGGINSLRGFDSRSVSPKWLESTERVGGRIAAYGSAELSFPLIERIKMRGFAFFDYGSIGDRKLGEIERYSAGAGIEWLTVIGPLQLIYARPLNAKGGDDTSHFEFNIGRRF